VSATAKPRTAGRVGARMRTPGRQRDAASAPVGRGGRCMSAPVSDPRRGALALHLGLRNPIPGRGYAPGASARWTKSPRGAWLDAADRRAVLAAPSGAPCGTRRRAAPPARTPMPSADWYFDFVSPVRLSAERAARDARAAHYGPLSAGAVRGAAQCQRPEGAGGDRRRSVCSLTGFVVWKARSSA